MPMGAKANRTKWIENDERQCKWIIKYLNSNTAYKLPYTPCMSDYQAIISKIEYMEKSADGREKINNLRNAWRQIQHDEKLRRKGIYKQTYAISKQAKARLKLLSKRQSTKASLNETLELVINEHFEHSRDSEQRYNEKYRDKAQKLEKAYGKLKDLRLHAKERIALSKNIEKLAATVEFYEEHILGQATELALLKTRIPAEAPCKTKLSQEERNKAKSIQKNLIDSFNNKFERHMHSKKLLDKPVDPKQWY